MDKKFVIAGTDIEFWEYARKHPVPIPDLINVHQPEVLHHNEKPHGVFIGTWRSRPDLFDIFNALEILWNFQHPTIRKIREDIVKASASPISVYLNGVLQAPEDYSVSGNTVRVYNPTDQLATVELKTADQMLYSYILMPRDALNVTLHIALT